MIAMQRRVLDDSMQFVALHDVVANSSIEIFAPLLQRLYDRMVADVRKLQLQRQDEFDTINVSDELRAWLSVELDEINKLLLIRCPMAFIVVAGRYAESDSVGCAIASLLYYSDVTCLSDEQCDVEFQWAS